MVPENIHTPHRREWKFRGVRDVIGLGISGGGGEGCCCDEFFFQAGLNFLTVVRNVSLFALSFSSHEREKINLANLKHKARYSVAARVRNFQSCG